MEAVSLQGSSHPGKSRHSDELSVESGVITKASVGEEPGAGNLHAGICGGAIG